MNGTGTAENPYIIMTAGDLYSMEDSGGSEIYFSLGADIDFNNTPYAENFRPIPLKCKVLYGNNHTIRNVNYSTPDGNASMFSVLCENITIENLKTENIRFSGKNVFLFGNSGIESNISLEHCVFVMNDIIILAQSVASSSSRFCLMHEQNIKISADYCTFAVKMQSEKSYPFFSYDIASHCQTKAEIHINSSANAGNAYNAFISESVISDSYFFLKIDTPKSSNISAYDFSPNTSKFSSSYLVCEPSSSLSTFRFQGEIRSTCFYDSTVMKKNNASLSVSTSQNPLNLYALTTEQCKDPVYLRSIGFNCAGAEE